MTGGSRYTELEDDLLRELWPSAHKSTILAALPGRSYGSLQYRAAKQLGLSRPRTIREQRMAALLEPTLISCYWWGFIYADGHIDRGDSLVLQVANVDREHLERFRSQYPRMPKIIEVPGDMSRFSVHEVQTTRALRTRLGMRDRKTYNPPENLDFLATPEQLLAFFVGFVDGDGSLQFDENRTFKSLRICVHGSWAPVFEELQERLRAEWDLPSTVTINGRGNASLYLGRKSSHAVIHRFIEEQSLPALTRKWNNKDKGYNSDDHHNDR